MINSTPIIEPDKFKKVPVLMVHPGNDLWTPVKISEIFFNSIASNKCKVILENAGHFQVEEPGLTQKDKNIPVYFEKENINTMDSKGEIMLTIMASLAQQESQSLSQNVKLGIQYRYQQGEVQVNHNRFLGYTKDENKRLVQRI